MVLINLKTILSIIGANKKTLATAKTALQSMVADIEGNETLDSGYLSRRDGTGGMGLDHSDITEEQVDFEAPRGDGVLTSPPRAAPNPPQGGWIPRKCLPKYCTKNPRSVDGFARNG